MSGLPGERQGEVYPPVLLTPILKPSPALLRKRGRDLRHSYSALRPESDPYRGTLQREDGVPQMQHGCRHGILRKHFLFHAHPSTNTKHHPGAGPFLPFLPFPQLSACPSTHSLSTPINRHVGIWGDEFNHNFCCCVAPC